MNKVKIEKEEIPKCGICYEQFDLNEHKPHSLNNCPHTICKKCVDRQRDHGKSKCPSCIESFDKAFPNLAFIELLKPKLEEYEIIKENDILFQQLKSNQKDLYEFIMHEVEAQTNSIKNKINSEAEKKINEIKKNQDHLNQQLNEIYTKFMDSIQIQNLDFKTILEEQLSNITMRPAKSFKNDLDKNLEKIEQMKLKFNSDDVVDFAPSINFALCDIGHLTSKILMNSCENSAENSTPGNPKKRKRLNKSLDTPKSKFIISSYEGEQKDDKKHGKGTGIFSNGDKYVGEWHDDKMNGIGIYIFANGDRYEGELKENIFHGKGTIVYDYRDELENSDKYVGEWQNNKKHGNGKFYFPRGDIYEGQFRDDKLCGIGTFFDINGDKFIGEFKHDKLNGKGTHYYTNGNRFEGEWSNDKKHGKGIFYYANGDKYQGDWRYNNRVGKGTLFKSNGEKKDLVFKIGKRFSAI